MSKELIESLRYLANRPPYSGAADIMLRAADALEAKAAPVGEREAFEVWAASVGYHTERDMFQREKYQSSLTWELWRVWQACAAYQRAPQPSAGVVMPTLVVKESGEWGDAYERGFKAALREFARLNGKEVGRG